MYVGYSTMVLDIYFTIMEKYNFPTLEMGQVLVHVTSPYHLFLAPFTKLLFINVENSYTHIKRNRKVIKS
jgi:hypothetical protein